MSCISTFSRSSFLSASSMNASWGNASTPVGKLQYTAVVLEFSHGGTEADLWGLSRHHQPLLRYSRGERPFVRRKNLLSEGVSAKWRRSAICWMLRLDVRSRKDASIMSIWLT